MDCSPPGSSVHGISRQEYWSGVPFPSPGHLTNPGIELVSPTLEMQWTTREVSEPLGNPQGTEGIFLIWTKILFLSINLSFPLSSLFLPSFLLSIGPSVIFSPSFHLSDLSHGSNHRHFCSQPPDPLPGDVLSGERWAGLWSGLGQSVPGSELCLQLSHHRLGPRSTCGHMPGLVHLLPKARTCSGLFSK